MGLVQSRVLRVDEWADPGWVSGASGFWVCRVQWSRQWLGSGQRRQALSSCIYPHLPPCTPSASIPLSLPGVLVSLHLGE